MACEIYVLTFASGRQYVGLSTVSAVSRLKRHASEAARGSTQIVHKAWRKYGAPLQRVLAVVEEHAVAATEARAVKTFRTLFPHGYNMTPGGEVSPASSAVVRAKIGAANKGRPASKATIDAVRKANTGRKWSEAERAAHAARKRKPCSEATRRKIADAQRGRTHSPEALRKMIAGNVGRKQSEDTIAKRVAGTAINKDAWRAKISASLKGRVYSADHRAAMVAGRAAAKRKREEA